LNAPQVKTGLAAADWLIAKKPAAASATISAPRPD